MLDYLSSSAANRLPGTGPLEWQDDLSLRLNAALHHFLDQKTAISAQSREQHWERDLSSSLAYVESVAQNRKRLAGLVGLTDERLKGEMFCSGLAGEPHRMAETEKFTAQPVRWPVIEGIYGEGLLLDPRDEIKACVVAIPDADHSPEQISGFAPGIPTESQFARRMAENGFRVVVPQLVSRACDFSGPGNSVRVNQSHREWIYRQAFEMGHHIIGLELQKVLAIIDWFLQQSGERTSVGIAGYGEGGLLAFYAGALDHRVHAAMVSGYFGPREQLWQEPVYRNVWGLLLEFGDAEIASLIAPRGLVIEYAREPDVDYSPPSDIDPEMNATASPGRLVTQLFSDVASEFRRIESLIGKGFGTMQLVGGADGTPLAFGSPQALVHFGRLLGVESRMALSRHKRFHAHYTVDTFARQRRQVREMEGYIQRLVQLSERARHKHFLAQVDTADLNGFVESARGYRRDLWHELLGRLDDPQPQINPRSRQIYDRAKWLGFEVVLDVWHDVFAWGILCVPKDLRPGERRPVVVCQHGLESVPKDTIEDTEEGLKYYRRFTARLADRGFVVFAPHNPYRGGYHYKQLQRKANPIKTSIASIIIAQHTQILNWLESLPFVDRERIGFYGLSYGGWTAVRIPPVIPRYCLSICSAAFNDWIRKVTSVDFPDSYMYYADFEMCEWNAGHTFSNAEMAYLMAPRPFMVERGMHDGVAPDSWVASEFAKVRWLYTQLGIRERAEIEFFNGEHIINGEGTFDFLHKHLDWPKPE